MLEVSFWSKLIFFTFWTARRHEKCICVTQRCLWAPMWGSKMKSLPAGILILIKIRFSRPNHSFSKQNLKIFHKILPLIDLSLKRTIESDISAQFATSPAHSTLSQTESNQNIKFRPQTPWIRGGFVLNVANQKWQRWSERGDWSVPHLQSTKELFERYSTKKKFFFLFDRQNFLESCSKSLKNWFQQFWRFFLWAEISPNSCRTHCRALNTSKIPNFGCFNIPAPSKRSQSVMHASKQSPRSNYPSQNSPYCPSNLPTLARVCFP